MEGGSEDPECRSRAHPAPHMVLPRGRCSRMVLERGFNLDLPISLFGHVSMSFLQIPIKAELTAPCPRVPTMPCTVLLPALPCRFAIYFLLVFPTRLLPGGCVLFILVSPAPGFVYPTPKRCEALFVDRTDKCMISDLISAANMFLSRRLSSQGEPLFPSRYGSGRADGVCASSRSSVRQRDGLSAISMGATRM